MSSVTNTTSKTVPARVGHIAVTVKDMMVVWGGYKEDIYARDERYLAGNQIDVYHPEFQYWTKHVTKGTVPPGQSGAAAYIVGTTMYVFAGHSANGNINSLYSLDLKDMTWQIHKSASPWIKNVPSPRDKFASWAYNNKLYCFGGFGPNINKYLYKNGSFIYDGTEEVSQESRGWNNQLLEYDISTDTWSNPVCSGPLPLPRAAHAAVRGKHQVYIFGGRHNTTRLNDMHCLDLDTYTWSGELYIVGASPCPRSWHTFTAVTDETAFLYGGYSNNRTPLDDAWQFDMIVHQWSQITLDRVQPRLWHTCCRVGEGELLVFGGCENDILDFDTDPIHSNKVLTFRLQPARLQRLCLETVYQHKERTRNQWADLPVTLRSWLIHMHKSEDMPFTEEDKGFSQGATCAVS